MKEIRSKFDEMVVEVLCNLVPEQSMRLEDGEGHTWTSECKDHDGLSVTIIKKDGGVIAKAIYDYDTGKELIFKEDFRGAIK